MKFGVQELCKSFGARDIFKNFSLEIESGQRLCICGSNGTGKSTFLKMLAGYEMPDSGKINFPKDARIGYVEQELPEASLKLTALDFVLDSVHDWDKFWKQWEDVSDSDENLKDLMAKQANFEHSFGFNPEQIAKETLSGLGFSAARMQMQVSLLSGGWRERAKLAKALALGADILLLDEPTNNLDIEAVEWLENFLISFKGSLAFVAHDRMFMDKVGTHILYLGSSRPLFRKSTYSQFLHIQEEYAQQREREAKAMQEDYERKMAFVERFRAKSSKARQAASKQKMAKKLEKQLEEYKPAPKHRELNFKWPVAPHCEKIIVTAENLSFNFPDGHNMWKPLNFAIYRNSRIALAGPNGSGKSTLLKLIAGALKKTGGSLAFAPQMRLGWFTQHHMDTLQADSAVLSEIRRLSDPELSENELMSVLGLFLLGQDYFERKVAELSGGEKSRLILSSLFLRRCNFLLLDEPTNNLDIESREALAKALQNYNGALLMVAHDRWFLSQTGAEVWALSSNGISGYTDFENFEKNKTETEEKTVLNEQKNTFSREEQKKIKREQAEKRNALHKALKPLQDSYDELEKKLSAILELMADTEKVLAEPETYADIKKMNHLLKDFEQWRLESEEIVITMDKLEKEIEKCKNES